MSSLDSRRTVKPLAVVEATTLDDCEQVIEKGIKTFIEVGNALACIRDGKLYRATHSTFEDYCRVRWGISRQHAYRQIEAAAVAEALSPKGDTPAPPITERVARELVPLKGQPEEMRDALDQAVQEHGPTPTAKQMEEVVHRRRDARPPTAKPHPKPQTRPHKKDIDYEFGVLLLELHKVERRATKLIEALEQRPDVSIEFHHSDLQQMLDVLIQLVESRSRDDAHRARRPKLDNQGGPGVSGSPLTHPSEVSG